MMGTSFFWDESFWFPADRPWGWKDLKNQEGSTEYRPQIADLHWAFLLGVGLALVRCALDRLVIVPVASTLGVSDERSASPKPNQVLEKAFKHNRNPDDKRLLELCKQTDMPEKTVQRWFRRRKEHDKPTDLQKFRQSSWSVLHHTIFFIYGVAILWNKSYTWKTRLCWDNWPHQHVPNDIFWYYIMELAVYWNLILSLFWGSYSRTDFKQMLVHHAATIILMYFSWVLNFVRVGSLVLLVHNAADPWLSLAKVSDYIKRENVTVYILYFIFVLIWVITRLIIYPYVILYCTTVEPFYYIDGIFGSHIFFNALLYLLQILHLFWTYVIFEALFTKLKKGKLRDSRSDSEDTPEVEKAEKNNRNGYLITADAQRCVPFLTLAASDLSNLVKYPPVFGNRS